jgi:hypothetical protein
LVLKDACVFPNQGEKLVHNGAGKSSKVKGYSTALTAARADLLFTVERRQCFPKEDNGLQVVVD